MGRNTLSDKQRGWLTHVEACASAGGSMKIYADRHGLDLQSFYLWKGRLKKLGLVEAKPERQSLEPVCVQPPVPIPAKDQGRTCIQLANGVSMECPGEFEADALAALLKLAMRLP